MAQAVLAETRAARDHQRRLPHPSEGGGIAPHAVAGLVRNPRPPRRRADIAGNRQRLKKRHLPLGHELRLRGGRGFDEAVGVEDEGVGCGSVGGGGMGSPCLGGRGRRNMRQLVDIRKDQLPRSSRSVAQPGFVCNLVVWSSLNFTSPRQMSKLR